MKRILLSLRYGFSRFAAFCGRMADDFLILCGCGMVVYATYRLNLTAAIYVTGAMLIGFGVVIGLGQRGRSK